MRDRDGMLRDAGVPGGLAQQSRSNIPHEAQGCMPVETSPEPLGDAAWRGA